MLPDSVLFIKQRFVDDFFYLNDSLLLQKYKGLKVELVGDLWTIEPFLFSITEKGFTKTYAVVGLYTFQGLNNIFGLMGSIDLYERRNGKWEIIEYLHSW